MISLFALIIFMIFILLIEVILPRKKGNINFIGVCMALLIIIMAIWFLIQLLIVWDAITFHC